ncbi:hypothetical protein FACS1894199_16090 [Bacteroidia bacterium]|nr:hypothetical protein FACS1894199_16090 [Bacteroidia bacterium]
MTFFVHSQSVSFLNTPSDARLLGMANAGYAMAGTPFVTQYNSAGLLHASDSAHAFGASLGSFQPESLDNTMVNIGGYYRLDKKSGMSFGMGYNTFKLAPGMDENGSDLGKLTPQEYVFAMGYAYKLLRSFSIAANLRFIASDLGGGTQASTVSMDVNMMYVLKNLSFGAGISNIGSKMDYGNGKYDLPTRLKAGGSYRLNLATAHSLRGSGEIDYQLQPSDFSGVMAGLGAEYTFKRLALRGGYHIGNEQKTTPSYISVGGGWIFSKSSFDFAYILGNTVMKSSFLISMKLIIDD